MKNYTKNNITYSSDMSEEDQLRIVSKTGTDIEHIINVGIIPSKLVRTTAIQNGGAWQLTNLVKSQFPLPDDEWISCIKSNSNIFIQFIKYAQPSELVLEFAFANTGLLIEYYCYQYPTIRLPNYILNIALTEDRFILECPPNIGIQTAYDIFDPNRHPFDYSSYEAFVKWYFKDNQILINKWIRYANNIRESLNEIV